MKSKNIILLLFSLLTVAKSFAQAIQFEEMPRSMLSDPYSVDFKCVNDGDIAFADVDNDNDQDVLMVGSSWGLVATLYTNDGNGSFTAVVGTPFTGVRYASIAFKDVDNDNDQDVLIIGQTEYYSNQTFYYQSIAKLYTNNGSGVFTEVMGTPFKGVYFGTVDFADIDNDNDQDVFITGLDTTNGILSSKLYTNDGNGNFAEVVGTPFQGVQSSAATFADIDNDNDVDVLITGSVGGNTQISKLYKNNGIGVFTEVIGTPFGGMAWGKIACADIDNDNDLDLLMMGRVGSLPSTKLYTNDGTGNYTEVLGTPFPHLSRGSLAFADVDNDNDQDVLMVGLKTTLASKLFINDGSGNFTEVVGTPFFNLHNSALAFADVDNDNDKDVLIIGSTAYYVEGISKLYINDGNGNYAERIGMPFYGVRDGYAAFADIDNDNDQDVLILGQKDNGQKTTKLSTNDGSGRFTERIGTSFEDVALGAIAFADTDNDNDQDVLMTGMTDSYDLISKLYTNDGTGNFIEVLNTPFEGAFHSTIKFLDIDSDNDQDVWIVGIDTVENLFAKLYVNNGGNNFTLTVSENLLSARSSDIKFADVDNDTDLDLLITFMTGGSAHSYGRTAIFLNDGNNSFLWTGMMSFSYIGGGSLAVADIDNDNDQDFLVTSGSGYGQTTFTTKLYTNDGNGNFTEVMGTPFVGQRFSSAAFADVDNDNDQDLFITGEYWQIASLYQNDGSGNFVEVLGMPFDAVKDGFVTFADIDNNNYMDLLVTGKNRNGRVISKLYRNTSCQLNVNTTINDMTISATSNQGTYVWLDCNNNYSPILNANNQSFTAQANGTYALELTINSCVDTSACITLTTAVIENTLSNNFAVFPNPSNGKFSIQFEKVQDAIFIQVYSIVGHIVKNRAYQQTDLIEVELDEPAGIYILELTDAQGNRAKVKLIKD